MPEAGRHESPSLRDYLRALRRRSWALLLATVLVPVAAVLLSFLQQPRYEATAEVLLARQNLAASLTGTPDVLASEDAARFAETQARLARVPVVAERVLAAARVADRSARDFLGASGASASKDTDLLEFTVTDPVRPLAVRLATEYARQFTLYRRQLDTAALERARTEVEDRIRQLEDAGDLSSPLYATLIEKDQQLRTIEALQTSNAFLVRPADQAAQVQPRPVRNGLLGLVLGLVLGVGLALLWEALDTRVRSGEEIGKLLGLPLLARLPEPPRRLRSRDRLVMLAEPASHEAEAFRVLRTNLDFVNLERRARTVMVTSATEQEGKSTTAANLAVALARAGRRVVLVDLDLRRPYLDRFFDLGDRPGVTDVALGRVDLEDAIAQVAIVEGDEDTAPAAHGNGRGDVEGVLEILTSGPTPPDVGEFVGTRALADILARLRGRADLVLIDSPPLLHVGDAIALSGRVDALVVITRLNVIRRPLLHEVQRVLSTCPCEKLGFILTEAQVEEGYGYGYGYGYYRSYRREPARGTADKLG